MQVWKNTLVCLKVLQQSLCQVWSHCVGAKLELDKVSQQKEGNPHPICAVVDITYM